MERAGDEMVTPSGKYVYMSELRELSAFRPARLPSIPESVGVVTTPLQLRAWEVELKGHPDGEYVRFILDGIGQGFRIGYDYSSHSCVSSARNMKSATEHPEPIDRYIREEVSSGRIIGPLSVGGEKIHVSRFGVIPKPHQQGKWRLITDLSSPAGQSVNDGVDSRLCSISYTSVDDAVRRILRLGRGTALAKFDIASAYRVVPVHPVDRMLLGMKWRGDLYVDGALPFGLRSAPKQFRWPPAWDAVNITVKELLPIVVACAVWGHQWRGSTILCRCDNAAVVAIVKSGSSKDRVAMHLMRCLFFFTAFYQMLLVPRHLPGRDNTAADHLSRDALSSFLQLVPTAQPQPTELPDALMQALVIQRPDWTSAAWRAALRSTLHTGSPAQLRGRTSQEKTAI